MEKIFTPFPTFTKATIKENEALDIMMKYNNILLASMNGRDVHKSEPYCVYIKNESDLHWFINLFGADRTRKHAMIKAFYNFDTDLEVIAKDKDLMNDEEFYCISLTSGDSTIERYNNHSCNGNIVQLNDHLMTKYNFSLKPNVLEQVYIINNGTPDYSMSGVNILVYQCSLISKGNLKKRQFVRINTKEKYIV